MKRRTQIWFIVMIGLLCTPAISHSQSSDTSLSRTLEKANLFFVSHDEASNALAKVRLIEILEEMHSLREKTPDDFVFLRKMFQKTNRKVLKRYDRYADFNTTMTEDIYGCLSGTALYSLILSHFGFDHEIVELPSHVYLKAKHNNRVFVLESTLGSHGFIARSSEVEEALAEYNRQLSSPNDLMLVASVSENTKEKANNYIDLVQLAGLQYYNKSIVAYRNLDLISALNFAREANKYYPSVRIKYLMQLVINEILQSKNLSDQVKQSVLGNYISHLRHQKLSETK